MFSLLFQPPDAAVLFFFYLSIKGQILHGVCNLDYFSLIEVRKVLNVTVLCFLYHSLQENTIFFLIYFHNISIRQ